MRRRILLASILLAPVALGSGSAMAAPSEVVADYFIDGRLDAAYSVEDLRAALLFAQEKVGTGPQYSAFADIVTEEITREIAGTSAGAEEQLKAQQPGGQTTSVPAPGPPVTVPAPAPAPAADGLPTPPPTGPTDDMPPAVPIMGVVALGLVAVGSASAVIRRRRRG